MRTVKPAGTSLVHRRVWAIFREQWGIWTDVEKD